MPSSEVLTFRDPSLYETAIMDADVKLFTTAKGEFYAELTQINLNQLCLRRCHETLPQICVTKLKRGRRVFDFLTAPHQPALQHCGKQITPHDIVVSGFDMTHRRTEGDCHFGAISLSIGDFDTACQAIIGHEVSLPLLANLVRPNSAMMSRLLELHKMVGRIAETTPDVLTLPEVVRSLEQRLIPVMIECLIKGEPSERNARGRRHHIIVTRFEEFLEANRDQPLYLTEICAALGVPERTLRIACEKHLGMGPIRYLNLRRMHLARRALLRADPSTATVTRLATDHGFWELGRFSVAYRTLFGESPSASLHRASNKQRVSLSPHCPLSLKAQELARYAT